MVMTASTQKAGRRSTRCTQALHEECRGVLTTRWTASMCWVARIRCDWKTRKRAVQQRTRSTALIVSMSMSPSGAASHDLLLETMPHKTLKKDMRAHAQRHCSSCFCALSREPRTSCVLFCSSPSTDMECSIPFSPALGTDAQSLVPPLCPVASVNLNVSLGFSIDRLRTSAGDRGAPDDEPPPSWCSSRSSTADPICAERDSSRSTCPSTP
mmetsp:Transcript_34949/g.88262  ORF Transcript_34949/g.88262 Transcript_34949/m.88262 type:complete len:212 (-) Transcript_34949:712-1347(-)